jgi:hypothetical protein
MISLELFDQKFLVEYSSRKRWLSEAEALVPPISYNSSLIDLCLRTGRNVISRISLLLKLSFLFFRLKFTVFQLVLITV